MSDDYFREGPTTSLVYWGLGQMMKGVGAAALFVVLVGLALWAVHGIGMLLPEESKQAPSPYSAVTFEVTQTVA
jgi:hypothetical protein